MRARERQHHRALDALRRHDPRLIEQSADQPKGITSRPNADRILRAGFTGVTPRFGFGRLVMATSFVNRYKNYLNSRVITGASSPTATLPAQSGFSLAVSIFGDVAVGGYNFGSTIAVYPAGVAANVYHLPGLPAFQGLAFSPSGELAV